jgi:hypothetical protein
MKKLIIVTSLFVAISLQAQSNIVSDIKGTVVQFLAQNPTNTWDVTSYIVNNTTSSRLAISEGWGGGARVGYWLNPSVGASLDINYCEGAWTFTSLGLAARGTINLGSFGSVSPYATLGAGWNMTGSGAGATASVVAVAGSGGTLHINSIKWFDFMGEYQHITTTIPQDRIVFGIVKRF